MNAYTSRSLYDDSDEEKDIVLRVGEVYNDSPTQVIIVVLYGIADTLQVAHVEKKKINPASSCVFDCLHSSVHPLQEYHLHIHFPGLMGLISPRTLQSAGYGFRVQSGDSYHVSLLSKKDAKVNYSSLCFVFIFQTLSDIPISFFSTTLYCC
jgi:hypothetical protein